MQRVTAMLRSYVVAFECSTVPVERGLRPACGPLVRDGAYEMSEAWRESGWRGAEIVGGVSQRTVSDRQMYLLAQFRPIC